jgi:hypothetical protein
MISRTARSADRRQHEESDQKNDGALLAGGREIPSPFGTFYASNITPDPETGIGGWSPGCPA